MRSLHVAVSRTERRWTLPLVRFAFRPARDAASWPARRLRLPADRTRASADCGSARRQPESEYLHWLTQTFDGFYLYFGLSAIPTLLASTNLVFWIVTLIFIRYQLPVLALYAGYLIQPKKFEPPALQRYAGREPLVSFIIAGRNPGYSIVTCI